MTADSLVSIVMCARSPREDWFRDAVGSALGQRGCTVELVLVDDGSPVPVEHHLEGIDDPRMRVIHIEHGGLAKARNVGIAHASGAFFRFADADDVLVESSTARLLELADGGASIAYGSTQICDAELRPTGMKRSALAGWIARECLLYRFDVRHMSMLFPRRVVDAVGDWDVTLEQCQDWDFVLRALEVAPARGTDEVVTLYRRHGASVSANVGRALDFETLVVDRYFERHPEAAGTALEREARSKLLLVRENAAHMLGLTPRERARLVREAIRLHPRRTAQELARTVYATARHRAGTTLRNATSRPAR